METIYCKNCIKQLINRSVSEKTKSGFNFDYDFNNKFYNVFSYFNKQDDIGYNTDCAAYATNFLELKIAKAKILSVDVFAEIICKYFRKLPNYLKLEIVSVRLDETTGITRVYYC